MGLGSPTPRRLAPDDLRPILNASLRPVGSPLPWRLTETSGPPPASWPSSARARHPPSGEGQFAFALAGALTQRRRRRRLRGGGRESTRRHTGGRSPQGGEPGPSRGPGEPLLSERTLRPLSRDRARPRRDALAVRGRRPPDARELPPPQRRARGARGRRGSDAGGGALREPQRRAVGTKARARGMGRTGPPWDPRFTGCRAAIDAGARVLTSSNGLLAALGSLLRRRKPTARSSGSRSVTPQRPPPPRHRLTTPRAKRSGPPVRLDPRHIDEIAENARLCVTTALTPALDLALENVLVEGPEGFYRRRKIHRNN